MNPEQIVKALGVFWQFEPGSRTDLEQTGVRTFRAMEVRPVQATGKHIVGHQHRNGGIVSWKEPDPTFEQARVFHRIIQGFTEWIRAGEATNEQRCVLVKDGENSELLHGLDFRLTIVDESSAH